MKKLISLMMIFAVFLCLLTSCADTGTTGTTATTAEPVIIAPSKYEAIEYLDGELSFSLTYLHKNEANLWEGNEYIDSKKMGKTKELTIDGKTYTFRYKETRESEMYNRGSVDFYATSDAVYGGIFGEFNEELNSWRYVYGLPNEGSEVISKEEALEKAKAFVRTVTSAADEFELTYTREYGERLYFRFERKIDGVLTNEKIIVLINKDGTLGAYTLACLGAFDGVDISGIDMDAVNAAIKEKSDKIYEGYTYEIKATEYMIARKADGSFVMCFDIDTRVSGKELEKPTIDRMTLYILLG